MKQNNSGHKSVVLFVSCLLYQDALIDTVRRSRVHFVHCLLPKAEALSGEPRVHGESCDTGLMQLDVVLLRAQLRGSKLLDALRIYRQGNTEKPDDTNPPGPP